MTEESNPATSSVPPASSDTQMDTSQTGIDSKQDDATVNENAAVGTKKDEEHQEATEVAQTNGEVDSSALAAAARDTEDTEMKDVQDATAATESASSPAVAPTNGTPVTYKKTRNGSSKKKGSVIPEHKSKKLNKKKSKPLTNLDAQPGEYYFARMKGHPPWPSIVCDEEMLPQSLLDTRPVTTKLPDGTYKKPEYADGGKRAYERTFPIMFLHTNEFAWMPNTELTPLDIESVTEPLEKGKSKLLLAAYEKATEQHDLDYFKEMLVDHQKAIQEDQEAQAEKEAKKASKAKRKSVDTAAQAVNEDEMDIDEEIPEPKPKSKKRKKELETDVGDEKPAKTPKTGTKLKLSTPKTPAAEPSSKKKTMKPKAKPAPKAAVSDDEVVDTPKVEQTPLTPAAAKEIKEKKVLYYRHKLQRGFLSRDTMPKEDEMKSMSDFLLELESFPDLEGSIIRATKIHKVLKAMIKLPSIPLDEEYKFKSRSIDLLAKWNDILSNDPNAGSTGDKGDEAKMETTTISTPATNGASKGSKQQAEKAEAGEGIAPEEESKEALENKIGTTVEGEKEAELGSKNAEKATELEKSAEENQSDEPDIEKAPAEEYKPSADVVETSA